MGSCYSTEESEKRVLILGLDNAGKTTLIRGMMRSSSSDERNKENRTNCLDEVTAMTPTQGFTTYITRKNGVKILFTDIGGAKAMRHGWKQFYGSSDILVFVIDCSDRRRLEESGKELADVLEETKIAGLPLLIFANKCDVPDSLDTKLLTSALNLKLRDRNWILVGSSGKTGDGIQEGVQFLSSEETVKMV